MGAYGKRELDADIGFLGDDWVLWVWLHETFILEQGHLDGEISEVGLMIDSGDGGSESIRVDGVLIFVSALEFDDVKSHLDSFFRRKTLSLLSVDNGVGVFVIATFVLGDGSALRERRVDSEEIIYFIIEIKT